MIEIRNLSIEFDHHSIFDDVNLDIPENSMVAIVGPNGIGKSTLLKILAKLIKPTKGKVAIVDNVTYLEQRPSFNLDFPITVKEMVETGLINNLNSIDTNSALEQVKISNLANKQISQLSVGQLQRGLLARAIVHNNPIWLLDESLNGIDQKTQDVILKILKDKVENDGKTIILSSHDLDSIKKYFDYVITLDNKGSTTVSEL